MAGMELKLDLRLGQKLALTPQLQQSITLLQLSRLELQQVIAQHVVENPLLEELTAEMDEDDGSTVKETASGDREEGVGNRDADGEGGEEDSGEFSELLSPYGWEDYYENTWPSGNGGSRGREDHAPSYEQTVESPTTLHDHLLVQLRLSSGNEEEKEIGLMIIGNIDEDGYLRSSIEEIAQAAGVSVKKVDSVLSLIQTFDPVGVAARDLQECLLIQLRHLHTVPVGNGSTRSSIHPVSLSVLIIKDHLQALQKRRYSTIAKAIGKSLEKKEIQEKILGKVREAVRVIEGLEPKPGRSYGSDINPIIVPDVFVCKDEGQWRVFLNEEGMPRVRINHDYDSIVSRRNENGRAEKLYLEEKLQWAKWVIRSLEQRNKTILMVVRSLVKFQEPFFEKGIRYLKPCVLRQVADDVGMHESTIGRVTRNKYMYCPQGLLELKFFFNAGLAPVDPGADDVSSLAVRELIREMVQQEDICKPLKDQEIVSKLRVRGMIIARRTVARYRTALRIPSASHRKRMQ